MSARTKLIKKRGLRGRAAGLLACPLIATGLMLCQSATAQTSNDQAANSPDQAATAQTDASTGALQEVVVTAERRTTNIMVTPISVVAVSGAQLQTSQIIDVN